MYGTVAQVGGLASVWSYRGNFYDPEDPDFPQGTTPTETTVTTWLDNLSAQMDIALATNWFVTPISEESAPGAYKAISQYVCGLAADLAHRANGVDVEVSPQGKIVQDMTKWVQANADGLLAGGATQNASPALKTQARFRVIGNL